MRNSRFWRLGAATAIGGFLVTGCYGYYTPVTTNLAGRRIQVSLTDSGALALAPRIGYGIESVDGILVGDSANQYVISVLATRRSDGQESDWKGESVYIPRPLVSRLMERRFSRARTTVFAGAFTIAMIAVKHAFGGAGGANAPGGTPGGGPGPR